MALTIDSAPAASSLAPGFRFHPTDEELVRYYLRRRICGKSFRFDAISDVDVYKVEPWDLPDLSRLKSRDLEWYFFSVLDKKYGNGSRTNRATEKGYWKTTGKDRSVYHRSQQIGMKKTLVYHCGRAPKGERTNWVMHEYRLIDQELEKAGILQDAFVLCRIFHKSGSGPKNGEKYGAPFIEEEWEDDESIFVPKQEGCIDELPADIDSYLDANDIAQILYTDMPVEDDPFPINVYQGENVSSDDVSTEVTTDPQVFSVGPAVYEPPQVLKRDGSNNLFDPESMNHGYIGEPSNTVNYDTDYLVLDEPYHDADNEFPLFDENFFFQEDDLKNTLDMDSGLDILNEYTSLLNSDTDNFHYAFDSIGDKNILPESSLTLQNSNDGTNQLGEANNPFEGQKYDVAPSTKQGNPDQKSEMSHPFLKKASYMLENIPAPPAFASEFPTKYLASSSQGGSVTSGMIHIRNVSLNGGVVDLSLGKHTQLNIVLSFGLGQREANSVHSPQAVGKVNSGMSRGWFYWAFLWIMALSLSFKIGSLVCPRSFMS